MAFAKKFNSHVTDAEFTLVSDDATFELDHEIPDELQDQLANQASGPAQAFLLGEKTWVISSNVAWIQYVHHEPGNPHPLNLFYVGYLDGSVYEYEQMSVSEALDFFHAQSYGKQVWDVLRQRGTVFGYKKPYRLVSGGVNGRVWFDAGESSQARHEAVLPDASNVPAGYHPTFNYGGAQGRAGAANASLNKKRGKNSKKVSIFTPASAKVDWKQD